MRVGVTVRQKRPGKGAPWHVFVHQNGKIVSRRVGTKREADTVAAELRRRLTAGEMGLGGPVSAAGAEAPEFSAYAWGFIERYAKVACKLNTWKSYETILRLHVEPGWRGRRLDEITRADVKRLLLTKQQEGLAPGTVQNIKAFVSGLFTHAYEDEILDRNPALRLGRFIQKDDRRKDIRPLTRDQAAAVLAAAQEAFP